MQQTISRQDVKKLVGKQIYAVKKDGAVVSGILRELKGNRLIVEQPRGKKVQTKLFTPLVLFDLLAIGTSPFGFGGGFGGFGGGFGGFGGGFGSGFGGGFGGFPGFF